MVNMLAKTDAVVLIIWVIIIKGFEAFEISKIKSNDFCKNDICLDKSQNSSEVKPDFNVDKEANNLTEKEIYFLATTDVYLEVPSDKNNYFQKFQETSPKEHPGFPETTEKNIQSTENADQLFNITEVTEVGEFTTSDVLNIAGQPDITKTISTSKIKLNVSTTPTPFYFFVPQNPRKNTNICFCDIQTNQCDINCCCDEDCNTSHFKVFTKCYDDDDDDYVMHDPKYCYSRNFIFANNTSYQMMKNNGGLLCIVRENVKFGMNYVLKPFTTLEAFNKSLASNLFSFSPKLPEKLKFTNKNYLAGSPVWSIKDKELIPFKISHSSIGLLCNSEVNIKYLVDEVKTCFYQHQPKIRCEGSKIRNVLHYLGETKIISNPTFLNKSQLVNSSEICRESICVGITAFMCESVDSSSSCTKILKNSEVISQVSCSGILSHIQYHIWHNGSEGIMKMEAYLWIRKLARLSDEFLSHMITEVKYTWVGSTKEVFRRSGNPGYLTGKPILAGRKVYNIVNGTAGKKEAIELSSDPKKWLSVLGSERGLCSSKKRIPINFRENGQFMCSLRLNKSNFSREKCMELQSTIFKLLIGKEIIDETKENYFNKFVATFGNSRVEETGDWVQVLIDLFSINTSPVSFKSSYHHLMCKNIITDLYVDIIYSKIGSFLAPQSKILGVSFQFGKHKDLIYYRDTSGSENTSLVQYFKLSTAIQFVDITEQAVDAFAEPLSLETKLPHDFFYPFFSKSVRSHFLNKFVFILFLFVFV